MKSIKKKKRKKRRATRKKSKYLRRFVLIRIRHEPARQICLTHFNFAIDSYLARETQPLEAFVFLFLFFFHGPPLLFPLPPPSAAWLSRLSPSGGISSTLLMPSHAPGRPMICELASASENSAMQQLNTSKTYIHDKSKVWTRPLMQFFFSSQISTLQIRHRRRQIYGQHI